MTGVKNLQKGGTEQKCIMINVTCLLICFLIFPIAVMKIKGKQTRLFRTETCVALSRYELHDKRRPSVIAKIREKNTIEQKGRNRRRKNEGNLN
jgi:hypothetical protein